LASSGTDIATHIGTTFPVSSAAGVIWQSSSSITTSRKRKTAIDPLLEQLHDEIENNELPPKPKRLNPVEPAPTKDDNVAGNSGDDESEEDKTDSGNDKDNGLLPPSPAHAGYTALETVRPSAADTVVGNTKNVTRSRDNGRGGCRGNSSYNRRSDRDTRRAALARRMGCDPADTAEISFRRSVVSGICNAKGVALRQVFSSFPPDIQEKCVNAVRNYVRDNWGWPRSVSREVMVTMCYDWVRNETQRQKRRRLKHNRSAMLSHLDSPSEETDSAVSGGSTQPLQTLTPVTPVPAPAPTPPTVKPASQVTTAISIHTRKAPKKLKSNSPINDSSPESSEKEVVRSAAPLLTRTVLATAAAQKIPHTRSKPSSKSVAPESALTATLPHSHGVNIIMKGSAAAVFEVEITWDNFMQAVLDAYRMSDSELEDWMIVYRPFNKNVEYKPLCYEDEFDGLLAQYEHTPGIKIKRVLKKVSSCNH